MNRALEKNEVEKGSRGNIGSRLYRKYVVFKTFIDYLIKIGKLSDYPKNQVLGEILVYN